MINDKIFYEHLSHIKKAHLENRLAIFVGAGFSKCTAKDAYPSWKDIIDGLKKDMGDNCEDDFLKLAEYYDLEFGKDETKKKVKSFFPNKYQASELHKYLIELYPHYIITTNWDNIFEATLDKTSAVYDIIAEDKNLPTSTMDNKIIKLHGDFDHDNYVFTESDYLNYSFKFPLIEAYLKGILATHTILFLGYGYGDFDLKLIMTWIKNNSPIIRNRYMLVGKSQNNKIVEKYYKSHNVILLSWDMKCKHFKDVEYLNFLSLIKDDDFKINITSPQEYVYELLKPIDGLRYILFSQIQSCLTNCGVRINEHGAMLYFYDNELSFYTDLKKRNKFKDFIKEINNNIEFFNVEEKIISIFIRCNIVGIQNNNYFFEKEKVNNYLTFDNFHKLISFDFNLDKDINKQDIIAKLIHEGICYYYILQYEKALDIFDKAIIEILKTKKFDYYFIALWNYNSTLFELKYNFSSNNEYENFTAKNIEDEYNRLPSHLRKKYKYIYDFTTHENIHSILADSIVSFKKVSEQFEKIQNGSFVTRSSVPIDSYIYYNLITFVLENNIIMKNHSHFKLSCANYVSMSFVRQKINNGHSISFNRVELYSIIMYFDKNAIKNLYADFYKEIKNEKYKFILHDEDKDWLINTVLKNCTHYYKTSDTPRRTSVFSGYICNIFEIIKFSDIGLASLTEIIDIVNNSIYYAKNIFDFFQSINNFFVTQYNLFYHHNNNFPSDKSFTIIKTLLHKFLNEKTNVHETETIRNNDLKSILDISMVTKYIFDDIKLINKIIAKLTELNESKNSELSLPILIPLHSIGNDKCKDLIKDYFLSEKEKFYKEISYQSIEYDMFLIANNITKMTIDDIDKYTSFFIEIKNNKDFDSRILNIFDLVKFIKESESALEDTTLVNKFSQFFDLISEIYGNYKPFGSRFSSYI